jgi:ATPase subunit of ABC transporter with duplicated ATPase domains
MLAGPNVVILDEPTNHLDLESIQALNNALIAFDGTVLFASHDYQFVQTTANRIVEIAPGGVMDKVMTYEEYLDHPDVKAFRAGQYA